MITSGNRLAIFDNFIVDRDNNGRPDDGSTLSFLGGEQTNTMAMPVKSLVITVNGQDVGVTSGKRPSAFVRWFTGRSNERRMTVQQFFASLKNSAEELAVVNERAAQYEKAIQQARELRQTALAEKLVAGLMMARVEAQLVATGKTKFVSEATVVKFHEVCERGLRLDWLANFTRPLPNDVAQAKRDADKHGIFDNYVVMHYDPQGKSFAKTQAQKKAEQEKKKDPILFGVIRGSRKLYFVADWVDEVCDLTLDQIAERMGAHAIGEVK